MKGHAEIAGGGIAGLALGTMLCQRGWSARVHERSAEIREIGAGLYLKDNSIRVMEEIGMFASLAPRGIKLTEARLRDRENALMLTRPYGTDATRVYVFPRQAIIEELRNAALAAGVEIVTGSQVIGADQSGVLLLENGERLNADLVVGCDGFHSRVRESLALRARSRVLPTLINRFLMPHRRFSAEPVTTEHYSGNRRIGVAPCDAATTYVYMVSPLPPPGADQLPVSVPDWLAHYPRLGELLAELAATSGTSYRYSMVRCARWQKGRVALVGDSVTAMLPTLGQGAGLTVLNARALVEALERSLSVDDALPHWEQATRFVSDLTQDWARRWDWLTRSCPPQFAWLKPIFVGALRTFPVIDRHIRTADRGFDVILPRLQGRR